jgi:hypothetical protein
MCVLLKPAPPGAMFDRLRVTTQPTPNLGNADRRPVRSLPVGLTADRRKVGAWGKLWRSAVGRQRSQGLFEVMAE